jgi:hypothetical protein
VLADIKLDTFLLNSFNMIPGWYLLGITVKNRLKNYMGILKRETTMGIALFVMPTCGFWWVRYLPLTLPQKLWSV